MADALAMQIQLLSNGVDAWIAEVEIPATGYRDGFDIYDYTEEEEAFNAAALMAKLKWQTRKRDYVTLIIVQRVAIEPAREEA